MSLYTHKRADNVKWVIAFVLIAVLLVGMAVMALKISDEDTTLSVSVFNWETGSLNCTDGSEAPGTASIRMKKAVTVDGLNITLAEDSDIDYSVYFYTINEDGEEVFLTSIDDLSEDFDVTTIPENAEVCRVVVFPFSNLDIDFYEIGTILEQISIVYNK